MRKYVFGVSGASPGIGGCVVVIAHGKQSATRMARSEVRLINAGRPVDRPVKLDEKDVGAESIQLPAVVHSYDGEM